MNTYDVVAGELQHGVRQLQSMFESVISAANEIEADEETVLRWNREIEAAKIEIQKQYPTYQQLLAAAAQMKVFRLQALEPIQGLLNEYFGLIHSAMAGLLESTSTELQVSTGDALGKAQLDFPGQEIAKDMVQKLASLHLNKVRRESKLANSANGAKGAKARDSKYFPLKQKAIEMASAGNFASANHAAYNIAPVIMKMQEFKENGMSEQSANSTVARWLREANVQFVKRS